MSNAPLSEADIAAIRAISEAFPGHMQSRDFDALGSLYTEDAVLMPHGSPGVTGRAAIGEFMADFPPITRFDLNVDEIDGAGDVAFVRGTYTMVVEPEGAPEPVEMVGKYIEVRARQEDGSWPISRDIFNGDEA